MYCLSQWNAEDPKRVRKVVHENKWQIATKCIAYFSLCYVFWRNSTFFFIAEGQARSKWNWEVYLPERSVQISFTSDLTLSETYN